MRLQLNKMINKYFVLQPVWSTCIEKQLSNMAAGGYDLVGINALIWLSQLSFERCSPKSQRYFVYTVCDTRSRRHLNAFQCAKDSILPYCETLYCDGYCFIGKLAEDVPENLILTLKAEQRKYIRGYHLSFILVLLLIPPFLALLLEWAGIPCNMGGSISKIALGGLILYHAVSMLLCRLV